MDKLWKESGDCFGKAAEMALAGGEKDDAANDYWSASKSYKKTHPECSYPVSPLFYRRRGARARSVSHSVATNEELTRTSLLPHNSGSSSIAKNDSTLQREE